MSNAVRDDRKTQTRRVLKNPGYSDSVWWAGTPHDEKEAIFGGGPYLRIAFDEETDLCGQRIRCPYGRIGDRLWVREVFAIEDESQDDEARIVYRSDRMAQWIDGERRVGEPYFLGSNYSPQKWQTPIFMPRWACRTVLEITEVRIHRLHEITPEDALAEGIEEFAKERHLLGYYTTAFARLWDEINGKRGYPWDSNPWIWALSFQKVDDDGVQGKAD
jgi:hypothetical protein